MLLALLLVTRAAADWVEISQQHYHKPLRSHHNLQKDNNDVSHTPRTTNGNTQRKIYQEQGLNETSTYLNRDVFLQKPVADDLNYDGPLNPTRYSYTDREVKPVRVNPFLSSEVSSQTPSRIYFKKDVSQSSTNTYFTNEVESPTKKYHNLSISEHNWNQNMHHLDNGRGVKVSTTTPRYDDWNGNIHRPNIERDKPDANKRKVDDNVPVRVKEETVPGKIERVPNAGSVKRVQLANTPVKSPALTKKDDAHSHEAHNYNSFSDELEIETNFFNSHENKGSNTPLNNFKKKIITNDGKIIHMDSGITENTKDQIEIPINTLQRPSNNPDGDTDTVTKAQGISRFKQNSAVTDNIKSKIGNKAGENTSITERPQEELKKNSEDTFSDFVPKTDKFTEKEVKTNIENDNRQKKLGTVKFDKVHKKDATESSSEKGENTSSSSSEIKVSTMENILKFMKVVADTISKNTRRGAGGKITYLNELKHTLLDNIKERIEATWPDDSSAAAAVAARRRSRSASPRGHVEFPSSESSLMTISFLTFAVFLIKLVLQVIQTYKHKTMLMAPLMVATAGRAAVSKKIRGN